MGQLVEGVRDLIQFWAFEHQTLGGRKTQMRLSFERKGMEGWLTSLPQSERSNASAVRETKDWWEKMTHFGAGLPIFARFCHVYMYVNIRT